MNSLELKFGNSQTITSGRMHKHPLLGKLTNIVFGYTNLGNYARSLVFKKLIHKLPSNNFTSILDLGCGYGEYTYMLAEAIEHANFIALDIDKERIESVQQVINKKKYKNVITHLGKIESLSQQKFDLIYSVDVFEHINAEEMPFKEAYNCLNDGGFLIVKIPNVTQKTIFPSSLFNEHQEWLDKEHIGQVYDLKGLEQRFKEVGFEIYYSSYSDGILSRLGWELAYLGKKAGIITQALSLPIAKLLVNIDQFTHSKRSGNAIQVIGKKLAQ
jgi:trans-aconitate methyltransferase